MVGWWDSGMVGWWDGVTFYVLNVTSRYVITR